ncbi:MAG TPA: hypothetical protein VMW36_06900 [Patescibacteria group bacterium]|nr:hypothetical protein [Patescibacteria group bacterium]
MGGQFVEKPIFSLDETTVVTALEKADNDINAATESLTKSGYDITPIRVREIKTKSDNANQLIQIKSKTSNRLLQCVERVEKEFEIQYAKIKKASDFYEKQGEYIKMLTATQQAINVLTVSMKKHGLLEDKAARFQARNINIINAPEMAQAFKRIQADWFETMDASLEGERIILEHPSPEMIEDFKKWKTSQLQKARTVPAFVKEKEVEGEGRESSEVEPSEPSPPGGCPTQL